MDNELLLYDRIEVIKATIEKYGEENFYIGFSGGKDSTTLHYLIDMALPNNKIPRVYSNTGIEYNMIVHFVKQLAEKDNRFVILKPSMPIKKTLEEYGYPFKSKLHSSLVEKYQRLGLTYGVKNYLGQGEREVYRPCPNILKYQFTQNCKIKISDLCCKKMKEEPMEKWAKENNKTIAITGIMPDEGGRRTKANCITKIGKNVRFFNPLVKVNKEFENWFLEKYNIRLCSLYYDPYNFERTGCKGCPFALHLEEELKTLEKFFPNERKQCEFIWKPVYDEYRRLNYRLKRVEKMKLF